MVLINGYISYTGQRYCNVFPVGMHTQTNRFWPVPICNKLSGEKKTFSHKRVLLQLAGGSYFPICHGLQKYGLLLLISLHLAENITSANFLNKKTNTAGLWIYIDLDHYLNTVRESMFLRWIIATLLICEEDWQRYFHVNTLEAVSCVCTMLFYMKNVHCSGKRKGSFKYWPALTCFDGWGYQMWGGTNTLALLHAVYMISR